MTELVKYDHPQAIMSLNDVMTLGTVLVKSGYFGDVREQAQAVVKILYGQELGIGPIAAMRSVYIVNGKPSLDAGLISSLIKRSGRYDYRVTRLDDEGCELDFFENGKKIGTSSYTRKDAQQAGAFEGKNAYNYKKYPRNMYYARAITNGARWYCADVFAGPIYTPDELADSAPASVEVVPRPAAQSAAPKRSEILAVDTETGEVTDAGPAQEEEAPPFAGPVQAEPKAKYDDAGNLHMNFKVNGVNFLYRNAPAEIAYLEKGDRVRITFHPEQIAGKSYNLVDSLEGIKDADGMTPWEERATEAEAANTDEPEPIEAVDTGASFMPVADLPAHL